MAHANPVPARAPGGLATSREDLELVSLLTPDDSIMNSEIKKKVPLVRHRGSERIVTQLSPSKTSPDGRLVGHPCPSPDGMGEFVTLLNQITIQNIPYPIGMKK